MKRVFIGYKCNVLPELALTAGNLKNRLRNANVKWASPLYWHITSHFIGKVSEEETEKLKEIVAEAVKMTQPFTISVKEIGFFPSVEKPRVLWAGIEPRDNLNKLYHRTGAFLRREGFRTDNRPYSPHITLARIKRCYDPEITKEIVRSYSSHLFGELEIREMILYESRSYPEGARYIPLFTGLFA